MVCTHFEVPPVHVVVEVPHSGHQCQQLLSSDTVSAFCLCQAAAKVGNDLLLSPCFCKRTAPMAVLLASMSNMNAPSEMG